MAFLPITKEEMQKRGWDRPDIVLITGDAYVDHPSFGTAIVSRVLEHRGFRVCIVSQPQCERDVAVFGAPRLAFFINGGNIDPMVNHYTVAKRRREKDYYTPGGVMGRRPDRATATYCAYVRSVYGSIPIAIGGVEASLRRFAHYDYWDNAVRPSILVDSTADILMYGMGERQICEIAHRLSSGEAVSSIRDVRGTAVLLRDPADFPLGGYVSCPSLAEVKAQTEEGFLNYAVSCRIQQEECDAVSGKAVVQKHRDVYVFQNPPAMPLTTEEMDAVYELPYERNYHPSYEALGGVPAIEEVKFSITHNRGCFGACNFCSIAYHQGRMISTRSPDSLLREARLLTTLPDFKGYIHDVGGPTANFRSSSCSKQIQHGMCKGKKCLAPQPCKNLEVSHREYLELLRKMRAIPGIKKVFIRSGIRFDYLMEDPDDSFFKELVRFHVSGQLKVAPEHCSDSVLGYMGKPRFSAYLRFQKRFYELTKSIGKKQYLVPYLMSSHPGSTVADAIRLASFLKKENLHPEQVQDFYPTPGTVSTCMYYTGLDPFTLSSVYVARSKEEKSRQRALLQYFKPENRKAVLSALRENGREDLIGFGPECLVKPESGVPFERKSPDEKSVPKKKKTALTKHLKKKKNKKK